MRRGHGPVAILFASALIYNASLVNLQPMASHLLSPMDLVYLSLSLAAYLFGSISSAILVCHLLTLPDPRIVGSHNPGATNVHRIGGQRAAVLTLLGDLSKTLVPLLIARYLGFSQAEVAWIGVCAMLGHCFPLYFSFKGGKGVASLMAILLVVVPTLAGFALGVWLLSALTFLRASVASIITAILVPVFAYQFFTADFVPLSALSAVVLLRHRTNLANILRGDEPLISPPR